MHRRTRVLIAVVGALMFATLAGCAGTKTSNSSSSGTTIKNLVVATSLGTQLQAWDACAGYYFECQAQFETLAIADTADENASKPLLAKSWTWSADRKVLSITLRDDVSFSDGEKMNAEAVKKSWDYILTTDWKSIWFSTVKAVNVTGEYTLDIVSSAPDSAMITHIAELPQIIAPKSLAGGKKSIDANPIGTGPYVLKSHTTTDAKFSANPTYWNKDAHTYPFPNVEVKALPDATARLNAAISGQVNFAEVDPSAADRAKSSSGLTVIPVAAVAPGLQIVDPNGETTPALANLQVRKAMEMAFDRRAIVKSLYNGWGEVSTQPWPKGIAAYDAARESQYAYDPAKAKQMIIDAGYPNGFTLTMKKSLPSMQNVAPIIEQYLGAIGVKVKWVNAQDTDPIVSTKDYSVQYRELAADSTEYIEPGTVFNPFDWTKKNPDFRSLVDQYNKNPGDSGVLKQISDYQFNNALLITLARKDSTYAATSGLKLNSTGEWYRSLIEIQPAS